MWVNALIPVQEAFHIDYIADFKCLNSFVNIAGFIAEVGLNCESVCLTVDGSVEVKDVYKRQVLSLWRHQ